MADSAAPAFYYDFNSPYAYLAAERLDEFVPGAEWRPIAFAILLNQLGELDKRLTKMNTGPIVEEVTGRVTDRGLPSFAPPDTWPVQSWSLTPLRADPDEVAAGIQRDEIKERLKSNTAEAFERGVTGIPTVAIGDELFWGDDHLEEAGAAAR
jgi:2-hydroxychromene-2-carboxylate isomerase